MRISRACVWQKTQCPHCYYRVTYSVYSSITGRAVYQQSVKEHIWEVQPRKMVGLYSSVTRVAVQPRTLIALDLRLSAALIKSLTPSHTKSQVTTLFIKPQTESQVKQLVPTLLDWLRFETGVLLKYGTYGTISPIDIIGNQYLHSFSAKDLRSGG